MSRLSRMSETRGVGTLMVGTRTVGVGTRMVGTRTCGMFTLGTFTVGTRTVGTRTVGTRTAGTFTRALGTRTDGAFTRTFGAGVRTLGALTRGVGARTFGGVTRALGGGVRTLGVVARAGVTVEVVRAAAGGGVAAELGCGLLAVVEFGVPVTVERVLVLAGAVIPTVGAAGAGPRLLLAGVPGGGLLAPEFGVPVPLGPRPASAGMVIPTVGAVGAAPKLLLLTGAEPPPRPVIVDCLAGCAERAGVPLPALVLVYMHPMFAAQTCVAVVGVAGPPPDGPALPG